MTRVERAPAHPAMMNRRSAAASLVAVLGACGPEPAASPAGCVPGVSAACTCTDGRGGAQVCGADRTFNACVCTGGGADAAVDAAVDAAEGRDLAGEAIPDDLPREDATRPDVVTSPEAGACEAPRAVCGGACVDLQATADHCGACGNRCNSGVLCYEGSCSAVRNYTSYRTSTPTEPFVDACAEARHDTFMTADAYAMLPFYVTYFTRRNNTVLVSPQNGALRFWGAGGIEMRACGTIRAPLWFVGHAALGSRALSRRGDVCTAVVGAEPRRRFVATWHDVHFGSPTEHITYSIVVREGTNVIDVTYDDISGPNTSGEYAFVGAWSEVGTSSIYACGMAGSLRAGLTVRFTPAP